MKPDRLLVIYASVHGQAELVARRFAETADRRAVIRDVRDVKAVDLDGCDSVVIVASVRYGRHARAITRFVRRNRARLEQLRSGFISVSGSAGDPSTRHEAEAYVRQFQHAAGWVPGEVHLVAGAVKFSRYNAVLRWMTKRAFAAKGMALDPHRDYDFTDWKDVAQFAKSFAARGDSSRGKRAAEVA